MKSEGTCFTSLSAVTWLTVYPAGLTWQIDADNRILPMSSPQRANILSRHIDVQIRIARTDIKLGRELRIE